MNDEVLIKVENVSKKFCKSLKRSMRYGIRDIARNAFAIGTKCENLREDEFLAIDEVSFELKRGECLGIIGKNGAGKSTLLKILNGIFLPDKGKITIKGNISALIEVGAGFHPMLTGRENIYINGSILGMSKKLIDAKFDEIVAFAELDGFIDSPVKQYSSGMYVRLGFAIAAQVEPDVLLLDEVLAVGDEEFRRRCIDRIQALRPSVALIFVSHQLRQIEQICSRAIYLRSGKVISEGDVASVTSKYLEDVNSETASKVIDSRSGSGELRFMKANVYGEISGEKRLRHYGEDLIIEADFTCTKPIETVRFRVGIEDPESGLLITAANCDVNIVDRNGTLVCRFIHLTLRPKAYTVLIAATDLKIAIDVWRNAAKFVVFGGHDQSVAYSITDRELIYLPHKLTVNISNKEYSKTFG